MAWIGVNDDIKFLFNDILQYWGENVEDKVIVQGRVQLLEFTLDKDDEVIKRAIETECKALSVDLYKDYLAIKYKKNS